MSKRVAAEALGEEDYEIQLLDRKHYRKYNIKQNLYGICLSINELDIYQQKITKVKKLTAKKNNKWKQTCESIEQYVVQTRDSEAEKC